MPDVPPIERRSGLPSPSRRRFLARATAATAGLGGRLLLPAFSAGTGIAAAACGSPKEPPTLATMFSADRVLAAGIEQRIPFAIVAPAEGESVALPADDEPVSVRLIGPGGEINLSVEGRVVDHDHVGEDDPDHQHANLFRYYPLRATMPEAGVYDLIVDFDGVEAKAFVQAFDRSEIRILLPGDEFTPVATPTFDRPDGVDRLCTRFEEPCPFHERSAAEIQAEGRPLALLVATPSFCRTAYCGPVVDTMMAIAPDHPDVGFVHAEVYGNLDEVDGNIDDPAIRLAPAVQQLRLEFEPSLFLVDRNGLLFDRIDNVFDAVELDRRLDALTS